MKYLVTDATGAFGARAIQTLSSKVPSSQIVASVREISKAQAAKKNQVHLSSHLREMGKLDLP